MNPQMTPIFAEEGETMNKQTNEHLINPRLAAQSAGEKPCMDQSLDHDPQTYAIIGAAMEVHKMLGRGFLEPVYQEAFACEMTARSIPFEREVDIQLIYKGQKLKTSYRVDFLCYGEIIAELKALDEITGRERSQVINYLKATGLSRALLINFGSPGLRHERFVNQYSGSS